MDSTELQRIERRARLRYEWSRARRAVLGFGPSVIVVGIAGIFAPRPLSALLFGAMMFAAGVALLWYGRTVKRAVLPGLLAGIVPLTLTLCANGIEHACAGDACFALCIPACAAGGGVAGFAVAVVGFRGRHGRGFWLAASLIALLTGAMGCICAGSAGLAALGLGYVAGVAPVAMRALIARMAS